MWEIFIMKYKYNDMVIIIGAEIAGLAAGFYAQMNIYGRSIYDSEELQESQILIDLLDQFYPGIKNDIEFVDVATPLTYERYTGNWKGSSCGWLLTKQTLPLSIKGLPKTLPKLRNFYSIGEWILIDRLQIRG